MHILLIHQAFAALDEPGGTRHHELARYLAAHGHRVTVIASPISYLTGESGGSPQKARDSMHQAAITILRASAYGAHHRSFTHRLAAFLSFMLSSFSLGLRVRGVDVVWGTSPPIFQVFAAWVLARLKGARFLFEVRDLWPRFVIAIGVLKNPYLIAVSEWFERFLYRRADRIIVNSPGFKRHILLAGGREPVLVPNAADPAMFDPANDGDDFRRENALEGKFVVMYAGAHGVSNDLETVLDAANMLKHEPIQIVLIGDGKEKAALQARAAGLGLTNVTLLPARPKSQVPAALAGAHACLAILKPLDEYKTTYPNKVFDYMAAGRPVLLAIDGVIREVVEAAGCGVFVEPGRAEALAQAILGLSRDRAAASEMGLRGREYLEQHFSREAVAASLLRVLEELFETK